MIKNEDKRISEILDKIKNIKEELASLESCVKALGLGEEAEDSSTIDITSDFPQEPIDISLSDLDAKPNEVVAPEPEVKVDDKVDDLPIESFEAPVAQAAEAEEVTKPEEVVEPEQVAEKVVESEVETAPAEKVEEQSFDLPVEDETPAVETAPAEKVEEQSFDLPVEDETPAVETAPVEKVEEQSFDLPVEDETPAVETAPVEKVEEQSFDLPVEDETPIVETSVEKPSSKKSSRKAILDSEPTEKAVIDVMSEKQAWRTAIPGSQVKNVISAISLNDRVLFINVLFNESPELFQETINAFNGMTSLNDALDYVVEHFPNWDLNSDTVYRLMMAVRRKLK